MRRKLVGVVLVICGLGAAPHATAQLQLRGADTLDEVTNDAIAIAGLGAAITYVGGGSNAGESFMVDGLQRIAPMSRELGSSACTTTASQLLIGLDPVVVVTGNPAHGDSLDRTASTTDNCTDTISAKTMTGITKADGVTPCDATDGCSPAGSYTFGSWREVLAMVYGGLNHNAGSVLNAPDGRDCSYVPPPNEASADGPCDPGQVCYPAPPQDPESGFTGRCGDPALVGKRNPSRVNCLSPVRLALVNDYGSIFSDAGGSGSCRTGTCTKLKHAFRMDDLSGATDALVSVVGLPPVAPYTRAFLGNPNFVPIPDRAATANPFCNGGERVMNRGDADYLDLDPIRRAVDHQNVAGIRTGLEQVAEVVPSFGGNNNDALCNVDRDPSTPGVQPPIPADHASSTQPGILPDPNIPGGSLALLQADMGSNGAGGLLASPYAASTKLCLGLVLPISFPGNYDTSDKAYFGEGIVGSLAVCDLLDPPGVGPATAISSVIMDTQHSGTALCPNGTPQPCDLPYKVGGGPGGKNFNCISDQLNPNPSGIQDRRIFNMHPVDVTGHYLRDHYLNSNIPSLNATRQARVVSAFYRLHTTRTTNLNGSAPTGGPCQILSSTSQIGCLVKASTCAIGFAGLEAVDDPAIDGQLNNFAPMIAGVRATFTNVGMPIYPMARTLWLSSIVGRGALSSPESDLWDFESVPGNIDPIVASHGFVPVPAGVTRLRSCPSGLP